MDVQLYMWHLIRVYANEGFPTLSRCVLGASDFSTEIFLLKRELQETRKKLLGSRHEELKKKNYYVF